MRCLPIPHLMLALLSACALAAAPRPADPADQDAARRPVRAGTDSGQQLLTPAEREEFSFVIFGDRTGGPDEGVRVLEQAVVMANRLDPAFVMTVGDMVQGYNRPRRWMRQMREYKGAMSKLRMPWYPVVGNHDVYGRRDDADGNIALYKQHFGPLYYSFDYRWAHFICLFSDEELSFSNPAVGQNMGTEQMQWLRDDLAATDAQQIFVFLHHPRWNYQGCNWDDVHRILADDGRVEAVIAGHIHQYRDDGVRDGIHYYTMAVTGGEPIGPVETAGIQHINLLRVTRDSVAMCVLPVGSVLGSDMVLGSELDEMHMLMSGRWMQAEGAVRVSADVSRESTVVLTVSNPCDRAVEYEVVPSVPKSWSLKHENLKGWLPGGQRARLAVQVESSPLERGVMPAMEVRARLRYPLSSGLVQPIRIAGQVPVQLDGLEPFMGARPDANSVLTLNGEAAARVDLPNVENPLTAFTLECWVRGDDPSGRAALIAKTEDSSFGIFWSDPTTGQERPVGYAHVRGRGYVTALARSPWAWDEWTHLAMVYDGRSLRFFVDGQMAGESPAGRSGRITPNVLPLYIGADPNRRGAPVSFFRGEIDEVRLSNVARYTAAFDPPHHHARDGDTLVLLHFDAEVAGVIPDDSGHDHHAWMVGGARVSRADR